MKKLLVLLMVLAIAAPSMAAVTLTGTSSGYNATIGYSFDGSGGFPRAFALTVTANNGAIITAVNAAKTDGQSTAASKGYGIFPGTISINTDGTVASYGTPVEPNQLHNTGKSMLNTNQVICALGSLYGKHTGDGDVNKPANSGSLFTITADKGCTVTITPESTYRGGVVDENAVAIAGVTAINVIIPGAPTTHPGTVQGLTASQGTSATQITLNWTAEANSTSYDVYRCGTLASGLGAGNFSPLVANCVLQASAVTGTTYAYTTAHGETQYFWVKGRKDTDVSANYSAVASGWLTENFPTGYTTITSWRNLGRPDCWCSFASGKGSGFQCDGDADGVTSGAPFNYRVYTLDLQLVQNNWKKKSSDFPANLNPCADIDHKDSGAPFNYRVYTLDLQKVQNNWKKKDTGTGALPKNCPRSE